MKLDIPRFVSVPIALKIPEEHWKIIISLTKENKCERADIIRLMIKEFIVKNNIKENI